MQKTYLKLRNKKKTKIATTIQTFEDFNRIIYNSLLIPGKVVTIHVCGGSGEGVYTSQAD